MCAKYVEISIIIKCHNTFLLSKFSFERIVLLLSPLMVTLLSEILSPLKPQLLNQQKKKLPTPNIQNLPI